MSKGSTILKSICVASAAVLGIAAVTNGIIMLVAPESWYFAVPGVTTTGPFNQHFVRDIGLIFLLLGGAFLLGVTNSQWRILLWGAPSVWLSGHAMFHFWEVAVGICSASAIPRDFPAVTLPALIGLFLTGWAIGQTRVASPNIDQGEHDAHAAG